MKYIVVLDENQQPEGMMQVDEFLLVAWEDGNIAVHQSDAGNSQRLEHGVRALAGAMKTSSSRITALVGAIAEKAIEQGIEQFVKSLPEEKEA